MTDTTKPNGDRELAKEFGFYPASTNPEDIDANGDSTPPRMRLQHMDTATTRVTAVARPPATSSSP